MKEKRKSGVVKVDEELLEKIEEFIKNNRFLYISKKQVVNLAVIEFLKQHNFKLNKKNQRKTKKR